jgi:hypothetical protein
MMSDAKGRRLYEQWQAGMPGAILTWPELSEEGRQGWIARAAALASDDLLEEPEPTRSKSKRKRRKRDTQPIEPPPVEELEAEDIERADP